MESNLFNFFFVNVEPKREAPTPPQPAAGASQAPSNLPYPVYVQGMPVPYAATVNTPYPAYIPPPMPQGYNPYGTMPYPGWFLSLKNYHFFIYYFFTASYNYPGGFPQNPQQQQPQQGGYPPSGYPQQPPPGTGYPW